MSLEVKLGRARQPARGRSRPGLLPAARSPAPHRRRAGRLRALEHHGAAHPHARRDLAARRRASAGSSRRSSGSCAEAVRRPSAEDVTIARPLRPRLRAPTACRSPRCSPPRPSTTRLVRAGTPAARRARGRDRRAARGPSPRLPDRLRRRRDQPVPDARDGADEPPSGRRAEARRRASRAATARAPEGPLEDRDLDDPLLPRRPVFEAIGLDEGLVERPLHRHPVAARRDRHRRARRARRSPATRAPTGRTPELAAAPAGGLYRWRRDGETPCWDPETVTAAAGRRARTTTARSAYEAFSRARRRREPTRLPLRGLLGFDEPGAPVPLDEVEPANEIVKRFSTGAMSLGALSPEAHETLAIAMNRLRPVEQRRGRRGPAPQRPPTRTATTAARGSVRWPRAASASIRLPLRGRSDPDQDRPGRQAGRGRPAARPQGRRATSARCATRSPGRRADLAAAPSRHLLDRGPQATHLRPPLRQPGRGISVKLAAESGFGTVAAGCVKAGADHVVIAGHDGGTGASPLSLDPAPASPGRSAWPRPSRRCSSSGLRTRVGLQTDGACGPAATSSSARCSAPTRSGSRPPR